MLILDFPAARAALIRPGAARDGRGLPCFLSPPTILSTRAAHTYGCQLPLPARACKTSVGLYAPKEPLHLSVNNELLPHSEHQSSRGIRRSKKSTINSQERRALSTQINNSQLAASILNQPLCEHHSSSQAWFLQAYRLYNRLKQPTFTFEISVFA